MQRIALVTCLELPEWDPDEKPLLEALKAAGMHAEMLPWDAPRANPRAFDLCVLRSCWNYPWQPEAFLTWIDGAAAATRLANPHPIVHWNLHKRYLRELRAAGVPIVPTVWFERGQPIDLPSIMRDQGWSDVVVKPCVSAGSFRTRRFTSDETTAGQAFVNALAAERDVMVQAYMPTVEDHGERVLVWIDGELTHAVRKNPRFADDIEEVSAALPVTDQERALMERTLACVRGELLYARLDVMRDGDGGLRVSELELIEPSLFLLQHPAALERLVSAIGRAARRT